MGPRAYSATELKPRKTPTDILKALETFSTNPFKLKLVWEPCGYSGCQYMKPQGLHVLTSTLSLHDEEKNIFETVYTRTHRPAFNM